MASASSTVAAMLGELLSKRQEPLTRYHSLGRLGFFVDSNDEKKRYKGITKGINEAYFPNAKSKKGATRTKDTQVGGPTGMLLGKLVDKELQNYTTHMRDTNTSLDKLLQKMMGPARPLKVHQRTLNFFMFLQGLGVIPIVCQLSVSCEDSRRSTPIDMVCWNPKTKKWLVLECKSGYNQKNYQEGKDKMHAPFTAQVDCEYNRHQLQLFVTTLLFTKTFGLKSKDVESLLVRVINDEIHHYPLEQWALDCENDVTEHFLEHGGYGRQVKAVKNKKIKAPAKKTSTKKATTKKKTKTATKKKAAPPLPKKRKHAATITPEALTQQLLRTIAPKRPRPLHVATIKQKHKPQQPKLPFVAV